jgi:diacylglycerol kinase family enzyme
VRVVADGQVVHEGLMLLMVASTTPFYGRGLLVNPGASPDAGVLTARVYPGPAARLAQEAARWASRRTPVAPAVPASSLTITSLTARPIPLQADGDHVGEAAEWRFDVRPAAVRLIGQW